MKSSTKNVSRNRIEQMCRWIEYLSVYLLPIAVRVLSHSTSILFYSIDWGIHIAASLRL